jgi:transposase
LLVKERTQLVNMIRGLLAEFGTDIPRGLERALAMARQIAEGDILDLPDEASMSIVELSRQALAAHERLRSIDRAVLASHRASDVAVRLATIPGIGPIGASALAASVADPHQFKSGREFAAWLGLTPLQQSSGGKDRQGRISKMGDKYLRKLLIVGMTSLVRRAKSKPESVDPYLVGLLARKPVRVATVAMANKAARVAWAVMARGGTYRAPAPRLLAA